MSICRTDVTGIQNNGCVRLISSLLVIVMLAVACGGSDSAELEVSRDEDLAGKVTTQLTPAEIFAAVAPSVVFVEVPDGSGSGVLLSSGYVVTNAHVVGHHSTVRLFTSLGELVEVPVYARDWSTDVALLGPLPFDELDGEIPVADLGSSTSVAIGDDVYLIGYPGEVESEPEPTMTSGILSRRRLTPCRSTTFLQTDALIAGGQSGGVLVDGTGQLIGISGLAHFTDSNFALVLAVEDVSAALEGLDKGSGSLVTSETEGALKQSVEVAANDSAGYVVTITEDQPLLLVNASSSEGEDVWLEIHTSDGYEPVWYWPQGEFDYLYDSTEEEIDLFFADAFDDGTSESLEVSLNPGIYVISTGSYSGSGAMILVEASNPLRLLEDAELFSESLAIGQLVTGFFSHFNDSDSYRIDLQKGDTVRIQVVSVADPVMSLYRGDTLVASSDNAGIGLYGDGAEIIFEAKTTWQYRLEVMGSWVPGSYILTLDDADIGNSSC